MILTLEKKTSFDIFVSCVFVNKLLGWNTNCTTSNLTLDVYVFCCQRPYLLSNCYMSVMIRYDDEALVIDWIWYIGDQRYLLKYSTA